MDEQKQIIKICRVCGYERGYDNYHILYVNSKKCASIRCAKHYQKNSKKILEKAKFYQENNKDKLKQSRKSHAEDKQSLYNKIDALAEMLNNTISVS